MEAVISGPELAPKSCDSLSCVYNDAPAEVWLDAANIVEEVV